MVYLVLAGLVVLLVVLVLVRSAQQGSRSTHHHADESPASASEPVDQPPFRRPADEETVRDQHFAARDYYLWESRRIARRGEARAGMLDFFGYLVIACAALVALGALLALENADEVTTTEARPLILFGTLGSVLGLFVIAALFFGFGAVVRNTSRSLAISAGVALDSFEPSD